MKRRIKRVTASTTKIAGSLLMRGVGVGNFSMADAAGQLVRFRALVRAGDENVLFYDLGVRSDAPCATAQFSGRDGGLQAAPSYQDRLSPPAQSNFLMGYALALYDAYGSLWEIKQSNDMREDQS